MPKDSEKFEMIIKGVGAWLTEQAVDIFERVTERVDIDTWSEVTDSPSDKQEFTSVYADLAAKTIAPAMFFKQMPATLKVRVIECMGFQPMRDLHQRDCPAALAKGFICNCVPDPTYWTPPSDVVQYKGETWEERLERAQERHKKDDE